MTAYTPHQLLVALGKARRHAWRIKKTVHVVENDGLLAWLRGRLITVETVKAHHTVVIRDVHPAPMPCELVEAYSRAALHDPVRTGHVADVLREIAGIGRGEPFDVEARALMLWDLAEHLGEVERWRDRGAAA
jgi:hypothetical protein